MYNITYDCITLLAKRFTVRSGFSKKIRLFLKILVSVHGVVDPESLEWLGRNTKYKPPSQAGMICITIFRLQTCI